MIFEKNLKEILIDTVILKVIVGVVKKEEEVNFLNKTIIEVVDIIIIVEIVVVIIFCSIKVDGNKDKIVAYVD